MTFRPLALASICLTLVSAAYAQASPDCGPYERLMEAQERAFKTILGPKQAKAFLDVTLQLPTGEACEARADVFTSGGVRYSCGWQFDNEAKARSSASAMLAELTACFPDRSVARLSLTPEMTRGDPRKTLAAVFLIPTHIVFAPLGPAKTVKSQLNLTLTQSRDRGKPAFFLTLNLTRS